MCQYSAKAEDIPCQFWHQLWSPSQNHAGQGHTMRPCCGDARGLGLGIQPHAFHDWKDPPWFPRLLYGLCLDPLSPTVSIGSCDPASTFCETFLRATGTHPRLIPHRTALLHPVAQPSSSSTYAFHRITASRVHKGQSPTSSVMLSIEGSVWVF